MLSRETKARIRRNRQARLHAPGWRKLMHDFQEDAIPRTLSMGQFNSRSPGLLDATLKIAELRVKLEAALIRYFGRDRRYLAIRAHSTRERLRVQAMRKEYSFGEEVRGFAVSDDAIGIDLRGFDYMKLLNQIGTGPDANDYKLDEIAKIPV
ncbi:hypothetical protein D3C71_77720 [compost metagenome]